MRQKHIDKKKDDNKTFEKILDNFQKSIKMRIQQLFDMQIYTNFLFSKLQSFDSVPQKKNDFLHA